MLGRSSLARPNGVVVVAGLAFVALAAAAVLFGTVHVDTVVREALLVAASPDVVRVMRVINVAGDWRVLLPATLILLAVSRRARHTWWVWVLLMIAAPIAEGLLKIMVARARPEAASYGFPSGHATAAAAYLGALIYLVDGMRPDVRAVIRILAVALMLAVGVARVMLRAHWPSDVLGGIALGVALASAAAVLAASSSSAAGGRAPTGS